MEDIIEIEHANIAKALLRSFSYYAASNHTGHNPVRPISKLYFSAQGAITSPPDLEFMGYGGGSKGEAFNACGGINLATFFPLDSEGDYYESDDEAFIENCFDAGAEVVLKALKTVSKSKEFQNIPKEGPIVFVLDLADQKTKVICRIHSNGDVELPPKKA